MNWIRGLGIIIFSGVRATYLVGEVVLLILNVSADEE